MIEALGKWIVTICVAIFFTTAVQMILPDGSIKKYCNFVLGLIVFIVMITPVVNLFNKDIEINKLIEQTTLEVFNGGLSTNYEGYRSGNMNTTLEVFKEKLEAECEKDLSREFDSEEYIVKVQVSFNEESKSFLIDAMEVGIKDGSVKVVEEIVIGGDKPVLSENVDENMGKHGKEVKKYISSRYDVDEDKIFIYDSLN